jgi:hypothetical protein
MKKYILIILLALATGGCATLTEPGGVFHQSALELKLSRAVTLLEQGKTSAAAELLTDICATSAVPGVTDEALFRLSLIRLGSVREMGGEEQAQNDLKLITKYYPSSAWAPLASGLTEFLASMEETRRQERNMKELNSSLSLENRDLKGINLSFMKEQKTLKEANLFLTKEQKTLKELNLSLMQENRELRQSIEKLKNLEMELRSDPKH